MLRKPANTGLRNFASETGHMSGLRNDPVCVFRKLEPQCIHPIKFVKNNSFIIPNHLLPYNSINSLHKYRICISARNIHYLYLIEEIKCFFIACASYVISTWVARLFLLTRAWALVGPWSVYKGKSGYEEGGTCKPRSNSIPKWCQVY